jgi:hypothetical protein
MSLDVRWETIVSVPQLDALIELGEQLVDSVQAIKDEMTRLADGQLLLANGQAEQTQALAAQLAGIQAEIAQFNAEDITQTQLDNLLAAVTSAADKAHQSAATAQQQVTDIQANTEMLKHIVPDAPPAP